MTIHIEALTFDGIIGLLDFERERTQRIIIDLEASYTYKKDAFIDYADITSLIETHIKEKHYELLEDALLALKLLITTTYPNIESLYLKISKPDILSNCSVALSELWTLSKE